MADDPLSQDPLQQAAMALDRLYLVRDTFFSRDPSLKKSRLDQGTKEIVAALDSIPPGTSSVVPLRIVVFRDLGFSRAGETGSTNGLLTTICSLQAKFDLFS